MLALSPLIVFLLTYLVTSIVAGDFYKVPVSSAFLIAGIYSILISKGPLKERIGTFSSGAGDSNVLLMVWIFILAGAFAGSARDIGAVDATVAVAMRIVPSGMLLAGLFLTACFISLAIGTSVGTIVALVPIAGGIAQQSGVDTAYMAALIVGGAFFGDNLSFISDTTIAATRALGCGMKDKFRANLYVVAPAVVVVTIIYLLRGASIVPSPAAVDIAQWYKLIPYLMVIVMALLECNVTAILSAGILVNAVIGFSTGIFSWTGFLASLGAGIAGMTDLIVITLLAGGVMAMIRAGGGMDAVTGSLTANISGKRGAQLSIAALVALANLCTANNTIAIITTGNIARNVNDRFGLDARKTASIMDTISCFVQGIIPYGAQILMASGLACCSPTALMPHLYYQYAIGISAILAILLRYPRKYSA